jgi:hypothetical protein
VKKKIYLFWSFLTLLLSIIAILGNYQTVTLFELNFEIIWLPIFLSIAILPLLNIAEIIMDKRDNNIFFWIAITLNISTIFIVLRYFKIELF